LKVALVHPSKVVPYARNPRKNQAAIAKVAASIKEFGFRQPIVVDSEMVIVVGHTRYLAAVQLGMEKVPVHVAEGLSPEQIKAYRIMDNRSHEDSEWDEELLALELADLKDADFDLDLTGFEDDEIAEKLAAGIVGTAGLTDPDDVPEPPDEAVTQPGDLWVLGDHRLLCGDSGNTADVDYLLAGAKIHLVNTDPPYNVKVEPRSNNAIAAGNSSFGPLGTKAHHQGFDLARDKTKAKRTTEKLRPKDRQLANDFVSEEAFDLLLRAWFGNIARVLEPGRGFYIWGGYANCGNYPPVLKACKLYFSQAIIWVKEHPVLTRKDFMGNHEWAFYGWKEGAAHHWYGPTNATDVWSVKKISPQKMVHLCLHPDALVLTESGYRPIRSIALGDRVYAGDGRFHPVLDVTSHPYQSSDLVRITAKGGNVPTLASDNHPFLVWRPERIRRRLVGGRVGWVRADEIRVGDYTMTPLLQEPEEDPYPDRDEEYWFLFGLYLAQGSLQKAGHGENRYPSFHLHKKRQDLVGRIRDRWDSVGEYDPNDYVERSQGVTVMAFDAKAGAEFEALGGRGSHAKRLAPVVIRLPRAKRLAVLQGWLNGDGCRVHDRNYWQGNTCSPDLAAHLAVLGESVGYTTNLFRYDPPVEMGTINGRRIQSQRPVYQLYFYARDPGARRGRLTHLEHEGREYALRYVKSVERVPYAGEVWNLTVEGSHTFQTAVGMSHNTEKPVELASRAMQYSSRPGEHVLDLFGGSGSTLIGAEQTGRRSFLMELDAPYCDVIVERWRNFTGKTAQRVPRGDRVAV
jgi:DNA modification methylase